MHGGQAIYWGGGTVTTRVFIQAKVIAGAFHMRQVDASVCFDQAESTPAHGAGWIRMANGKWQVASGKWQVRQRSVAHVSEVLNMML